MDTQVVPEVRTISAVQVDVVQALGGSPTNRPLQPAHGRPVTLEGVTSSKQA